MFNIFKKTEKNKSLQLTLYESIQFFITDIIENWIYPGYYLRNLLFNRYDLIKLKGVSKYKYIDIDERMFLANMSLINNFIEKEKPEDHVLWYKDENGNDIGHKYIKNKNKLILFPEYENKFIMDIIKEIYNWYNIEYPLLQHDIDYLLSFWCDNIVGEMTFEEDTNINLNNNENNKLFSTMFDNSKCPKTLNELKLKQNINWDIIHKYIQNDEDIFKENFVHKKIIELEDKCFYDKQKYLHLCIEVRPYLWV